MEENGLSCWNATGPLWSHLLCHVPLSSVATVNDLACRGLDKLEEKLPFLQQPSDTVLEMTRPRGTP